MNEKKERMILRQDRKPYLFYPEDKFKQHWDILITICILFTCCSTPLYVSFHDITHGMDTWYIINLSIDIIFGMDIIVIFFSAFYDDDYQLIDNFKDISRNYFFGWFILDILAITPFEEFFKN